MSISGVQGLPLEVAVVACYNLDDNHWISKQDPFVTIQYGNIKYGTKQCKDGRRNPTFEGKFIFTLIEGLHELNVAVWNYKKSNEQLGTGRVLLHKVVSQGFQDASWSLQNRDGKHAGEIRLILNFPHANKQKAKLESTGPAQTKTLAQFFESKSSPRGAEGRAPAATCCSATRAARPTTPPYSPPSPCTGTGYPPPNTTNSPPVSPYPYTGYTYPPNVSTTYPPNVPTTYPPSPVCSYPPHPYPAPAQLSICYPTGLSVYPPPPPSAAIYPPQPQVYPPPPY